ncbi:MAG: fatty acid desaturase [Gammaproteobacteria bacterium]
MFRFSADRLPVAIVLLFSLMDFCVYFLVDNLAALISYMVLMIIPKGCICAWNHHHQHTRTFHSQALNRVLEFFYALHTGVTTNLWVLHHVLGHHRNYLDQSIDESGWQRADGSKMNSIEYTLTIAGTAYQRGYKVGNKFPRVQRDFVIYGLLTLLGVAALIWYKPMAGVLVFALPMVISLLFTAWVTYDHHSGLDTDDVFTASYNNTGYIFNLLTGNLGYHTAHHYRQGLHWSKLPELHAKLADRIPDEFITNHVMTPVRS